MDNYLCIRNNVHKEFIEYTIKISSLHANDDTLLNYLSILVFIGQSCGYLSNLSSHAIPTNDAQVFISC